MARFTIIVLLVCLGALGYLYYDQVTDHSVVNTLKERIQHLEQENGDLKTPKRIPRAPLPIPERPPQIQPEIIVPPRFEIKRAEPLSKPAP